VDVRIVGTRLPGRAFHDVRHDGCTYSNVHVGVQCRRDVVEIVPGDAPAAEWNFPVDVVPDCDPPDFRGPHVQGKRGDRFVYLSWGAVDDEGNFQMFRRAKLMLAAVPAAVLASANQPGQMLLGALGLTAADGSPVCAATRPPAISWTAAPIAR
jgi:Family of unknown function (DUF5990)